MFVLSPSVATTTASASSVTASSRSSIATTSQPARSSSSAIADPTRPQPITRAFTARLSVAHGSDSGEGRGLLLLADVLRERDDQHLAGRLLQDVLDGRREEAGLPA